MGAAAEIAHKQAGQVQQHMRQMRDRLREGMLKAFPTRLVRVNGSSDQNLLLPNTLSISIKGLSAPSLLQQLMERLAASAGAACHSSHGPSVSPVLQAIQLPPEFAVGTLRLSTGRHTTAAEVDAAVKLIYDAACKQGLELDQQ
eukprot:GHUV01020782.1.p1 GENE.GHUV01020782.1~~GHUV01020782.1.p1  ORF type:complete len:144 (-),score=49.14 GHUV01020782.1:1464-1895(-)